MGRTKLISNTEDHNLNLLWVFLASKIRQNYACNIYLPSYSKAVVQVVNKIGICEKIIKIALDESAVVSLRKEQENLCNLKQYSFNNFEIPDVLNSESMGNMFFVEYSCPAKYCPHERLDTSPELLAVLTELFLAEQQTVVPLTESTAFRMINAHVRDMYDLELRKECIDIFEHLAQVLRKVSIPVGIVHNDLKQWNMLENLTTKRLFIVDWEMMQKDGFPLWDAYCYVLFTYLTIHPDAHPTKVLKNFQKQADFFKRYNQILKLDPSLVEALMPLYLLDLLTIKGFWNRWEQGESRPQRVYSGILSLLRYLTMSYHRP